MPIGGITTNRRPREPLASMVEREDVARAVKKKFKLLDKFNLAVVETRGNAPDDFRKLEFRPPDERDNPIPGRPTVEVFDPSFKGEELENMVAADFIHYLPRVDKTFRQIREGFKQTLTREQKAIDRMAYIRARRGDFGYIEDRSFEEWFEVHRLDQYLGAGFLPKDSPHRKEWLDGMTDEQKEILDAIENYMRTGK